MLVKNENAAMGVVAEPATKRKTRLAERVRLAEKHAASSAGSSGDRT